MLTTNNAMKKLKNEKLKVLTDDEIKKIQKIILDMIQELDNIFKKYNFTYYLGGGSALGAIRHKGFIPWDEDLDLNMIRKDYDKLIEIFDKEPLLK